MDTVTIPRTEYNELKRHRNVDEKLIKQLIRSLEDVKHGRIEDWND